jgi:hypothetical protein
VAYGDAPALILKGYAEKAATYQRLAAQAKDFAVKSFYLNQAQRLRELAKPIVCEPARRRSGMAKAV